MRKRLEDLKRLKASLLLCLFVTACSQQSVDTLSQDESIRDKSHQDKSAQDDDASFSLPGSVPDAQETLRLIPPKGWTLLASSNRGTFRRAEYLRDAAAEYPEMLTVEAFPAQDQPEPMIFLDTLAAHEQGRCSDFSRHLVFAGEERGFPAVVEVHRCPQQQGTNQATVRLIKVIQGKQSYVVLTLAKEGKAQRDDDGWTTAFATEEDMATWALFLRQAYLVSS